jgi:hypothetical protein
MQGRQGVDWKVIGRLIEGRCTGCCVQGRWQTEDSWKVAER